MPTHSRLWSQPALPNFSITSAYFSVQNWRRRLFANKGVAQDLVKEALEHKQKLENELARVKEFDLDDA